MVTLNLICYGLIGYALSPVMQLESEVIGQWVDEEEPELKIISNFGCYDSHHFSLLRNYLTLHPRIRRNYFLCNQCSSPPAGAGTGAGTGGKSGMSKHWL